MATSRRRVAYALRPGHEDEGIGLILVIGISAMMAILLAVITATAIRSLESSSDHVKFEQSLAAAEAGIDRELSSIQSARNQVPSVDLRVLRPPAGRPLQRPRCSRPRRPRRRGPSGRSRPCPPAAPRRNGQGEYVAFKVPGRQVVYSMGWSPSRTAAERQGAGCSRWSTSSRRTGPGKALLTGGNIDFSGSVGDQRHRGSAGRCPHQRERDRHQQQPERLRCHHRGRNGQRLRQRRRRRLPDRVSRPSVFRLPTRVRSTPTTPLTTGQWYDLCDTGVVKLPSASGPCTGTQVSASPYRSWYWTAGNATTPGNVDAAEHRYLATRASTTSTAPTPSSAPTATPATVQTVTVLAESTTPSGYTNAATCNKYGGNISWKLFDIQNYLRGVLFIAQGSLDGNANSTAQAGLMMAGDKIDLQTSSATVKGCAHRQQHLRGGRQPTASRV